MSGNVKLVSVTPSKQLVILSIDGNGFDQMGSNECLTPNEARYIAKKLMEAADTVEANKERNNQ